MILVVHHVMLVIDDDKHAQETVGQAPQALGYCCCYIYHIYRSAGFEEGWLW